MRSDLSCARIVQTMQTLHRPGAFVYVWAYENGFAMRSIIFFCLAFVLTLVTAARSATGDFACTGYALPQLSPGVTAKRTGNPSGFLPSQGSLHALVVFAKFESEALRDQGVPGYATALFDVNLPGSFSHFYHTMSFGQFEVRGSVLPRRYTSDRPAAAYLAQESDRIGRFGQFALEILRQVDRDIDFGEFDNDGPDGEPNSGDDDGVVDYVFVNMLSVPQGFLQGAATGIAGLGFGPDFVSRDLGRNGAPIRIGGGIANGAMQQEGNLAQTVGAMAHEFGHSLGLPDLYDLSRGEPAKDSAGIGGRGLMGWGTHGWNGRDGPNPFCAWSLEQLGWIGAANGRLVEIIDDTSGLVVEDLRTGGSIYKIPLQVEATGRFSSQFSIGL